MEYMDVQKKNIGFLKYNSVFCDAKCTTSL